MQWRGLTLGFLLGIMAGVVLGYAWAERGPLLWLIGALVLLLGVLSTIWSLRASHSLSLGPMPDLDPQAAPMLGQMLVNYGLISEADLSRALERQERTGKRLGKVLVSMRLVTHAQIAEALEEQLYRRRDGVLSSAEPAAAQQTVGSGAVDS